MRKSELKGKKCLEVSPERKVNLEYYLIKEEREDLDSVLYGVSIRKNEGTREEIEEISGITYSKEIAENIVHLLMTHDVTPIAMIPIVDDFITERICS
ncbi:DUF6514 family protein [Anaeromicropila populeti]|uniref:Uncharacterized protein n=1 Tax=Anaeromicropila populeti TaxID=37658 RepID=A0A1I6JQV9_9FIRM|nr:DUF6514 family protein [Anaeromicropila populeti]SFR81343.1 hypothetical protein SAMN05661086_01887 [Anaeromicropila populeti]